MGAYSPVPLVAPGDEGALMEQFVFPTLHHLAAQGAEYRGVLYAGLMFTPAGPKLVEYNIRFGDPECQVVVPRLTSDLAELLHAAAAGVPLPDPKFSGDACVGVVVAVEGYPTSPRTGDVVAGLDDATRVNSVTIFHAGTDFGPNETLVTAGGRVLDVVATGPTLADARARAYEAAEMIEWPGVYFRRDIAAEVS
jgi:phosphoribosylamine--glycine ligase